MRAREQKLERPLRMGMIALILSVTFCALAHLLLRRGAIDFSSAELLSNWRLAVGLAVYATGTLLWIYCLGKLNLSVAFPASAVQLILVLAGAHWILGENISPPQIIGVSIILTGITLLYVERRAGQHA